MSDADSLNPHLQRCLDVIERHGHLVQYVGDVNPPFAYTVGLSASAGHGYELAVAGLDPETSRNILNDLARDLNGREPEEGMLIHDVLIDGYPLRMRLTSPGTTQFGWIRAVYLVRPPVWQAVWPDVAKRFPDDPSCTGKAREQAML